MSEAGTDGVSCDAGADDDAGGAADGEVGVAVEHPAAIDALTSTARATRAAHAAVLCAGPSRKTHPIILTDRPGRVDSAQFREGGREPGGEPEPSSQRRRIQRERPRIRTCSAGRERRDHSGHQGAARPDSGSSTSRSEPWRMARVNVRRRAARSSSVSSLAT